MSTTTTTIREALERLERAVDLHLGRSSWTQTKHLKGLGYSEQVRKELYAAHDAAREALASQRTKQQAGAAPTVEQAIEALKVALRDSKGWNLGYSDAIIRDAIDRVPAAREPMTDTAQPWTPEHLKAYPTDALAILNRQAAAREQEGEPIAWEAPRGLGIKPFVSDRIYRLYSAKVQRFYKPFRCASCAEASATGAEPDWKAEYYGAQEVLTKIRTAMNASGRWALGVSLFDAIDKLLATPTTAPTGIAGTTKSEGEA